LSRFLPGAFCAVLLAFPCFALADTWDVDQSNSSAGFSVRHMGISTVRGSFRKVGGTVEYSPGDLSKTAINVTIDTASLDTGVEMRDNHVRGSDFLDAARYPKITFRSKRVESTGSGKLKITGDLMLHGVTKTVVLDVEGPSSVAKDSQGVSHMGASATTKINREEFGVSGTPMMVGDDVTITIDVEMVKPAVAH